MKALIVVPSLAGGGAEKSAIRLAKSLPKTEGFEEVSLAVFSANNMKYKWDSLINLDLPPKKTRMGKVYQVVRRSLALQKKMQNYDVVIGMTPSAILPLTFVRSDIKKIASVRTGSRLHNLQNSFLFNKIINLIVKKFDGIIVQNYHQKSLLQNYIKEKDNNKIHVINNMYDNQKIKQKSEINTNQAQDYFLYVGRLNPVKNVRAIIDAFDHSQLHCKNIKLLILGEGEEKMFLKNYVAEKRLENFVEILPFQENPYPYMKNAIATVLASKAEGFPNVLAESLIVGTPIISTDCPTGPNEILNSGHYQPEQNYPSISPNGILVSTPTEYNYNQVIKELSDSLDYMYKNKEDFKLDFSYIDSLDFKIISQKWAGIILDN